MLTLREQGVNFALKVNQMGHNVLSAAAFGDGPSGKGRSSKLVDPYFLCAFVNERPDFPNGGLHLPSTVDGLYCWAPPRTLSACKAVSFGDARCRSPSDPENIMMELHVN